VGDSGWGAYHGEQGFLRFSHQKAVCVQGRWSAVQWLYPPYGALRQDHGPAAPLGVTHAALAAVWRAFRCADRGASVGPRAGRQLSLGARSVIPRLQGPWQASGLWV
jgi:hypothetical protein